MTPDQLETLYGRAFHGERGWRAAEFEALAASPGAVLCGDPRSALVGRVIADQAEILTLATDPDHRRKGLARARLADFETRAGAMGAAAVFLEVSDANSAALALYHRAGYAEVGRRTSYYGNADGTRSDALLMRKSLDIT